MCTSDALAQQLRRLLLEIVLDQPREAARLRHREAARFGARAARDVGDRSRARSRQPRGRQPSIQTGHLAALDPAQHEILIDRDAHHAVRIRPATAPPARASARGDVAQLAARRSPASTRPASAAGGWSAAIRCARVQGRRRAASTTGTMPGPLTGVAVTSAVMSAIDGGAGRSTVGAARPADSPDRTAAAPRPRRAARRARRETPRAMRPIPST